MKNRYFWAFTLLILVYVGLAFGLPSDPEVLKRYEITQGQARLLNLTIIAPIVIVYFTALYGFLRFRSYAKSIENSKEGKPLKQISIGLAVLAFGLPIASIMGSLLNYIQLEHSQLITVATILRSYIALLFQVVAFSYIALGAQGLIQTLKRKPVWDRPVLTLLGPIILASIFTWLITSQPHEAASQATYHLPNWLVILTLAVPYVYIWCKGIQAAYKLNAYKDTVKGLLYKRAIGYLAKGIGAVIAVSILIQFITTLSAQLNRLDLGPLLLLLYILIILYALGYGLVARGAKKLKQIEEA